MRNKYLTQKLLDYMPPELRPQKFKSQSRKAREKWLKEIKEKFRQELADQPLYHCFEGCTRDLVCSNVVLVIHDGFLPKKRLTWKNF